jgi:hypothetical protein
MTEPTAVNTLSAVKTPAVELRWVTTGDPDPSACFASDNNVAYHIDRSRNGNIWHVSRHTLYQEILLGDARAIEQAKQLAQDDYERWGAP